MYEYVFFLILERTVPLREIIVFFDGIYQTPVTHVFVYVAGVIRM